MPNYEVELDDGRRISIDADTQDAALAGAQHFLKTTPAQSKGQWPTFAISDGPAAVRSNAAAIQQARDQGYSDQNIADHVAANYPSLMLNHLSGTASSQNGPWTDYQKPDDGPWKDYQNLPPLPNGFQLQHPRGGPPLPDGFVPERPGAFDSLPKTLQFDDLPRGGPQPNDPSSQASNQNAPVTAGGSAKAIGAGAATGIAGIPGDLIRLGNLVRKIDPLNLPGMTKTEVPVPSMLNKVEQAADNLYQPQNQTESALKTASSIVAPVVIGGPETLVGKGALGAAKVLAKRAVTQAAIPTAAADVADYAAQGTPLEGYAGPLAALAAGGLSIRGKPASVSLDAAKAATDASYDAARNAGVTYDPHALAAAASAKKAALEKAGISERSAPSAHDTLDSFMSNTSPMSLTDLEEHRQLIGGDLSKGGKEAKAAGGVRDVIDSVMSNPKSAVSGADPAGAYDALQRARTQALATQRLKDVDTMVHDAQVTHNVHGTEINKAIKMQFGSALKNEDTMRGFSDPDMASQMHAISAGAFPQGIAKKLGGGDLSNWRVPELAALAFPPFAPAVVAMRALGYGLSKQVDAKALAKVARLRAQIARQAGLPVTPATNPWPTRALVSTLATQPGNGQ